MSLSNLAQDAPENAPTRQANGRARVWRWIPGTVGAAVWVGAVAVGMLALWRYASIPGQAAAAPVSWPANTTVPRLPRLATIVMAAHPKCPCTRASITELAVLMQRLGGRAHAHVLFMRPSEYGEGWERTGLWRQASTIPGVTASADVGGIEAARFGAATSGQTVVYDAAGRLVFQGGITFARGHVGDNLGVDRIVRLLTHGSVDKNDSQVFGCALAEHQKARGESIR